MASTTFLTEQDLAKRWQCKAKTLQNWRIARTGPKYLKIGAKILYRLQDIEAYEENNIVSHE
jgi:hypothetical protein